MKIPCDVCGQILKEPGGLAFSPPGHGDMVTKYHMCIKCWDKFLKWVNGL